jgi:hypothetical protein
MSRSLYATCASNPVRMLCLIRKQVEVGGGLVRKIKQCAASGEKDLKFIQQPDAHIRPSLGVRTQMDYDSLRRQARTLEFLLDSKLTAYSRVVTTITTDGVDVESGGSVERWQDLQAEVEDLLEKVGESDMSSWVYFLTGLTVDRNQ